MVRNTIKPGPIRPVVSCPQMENRTGLTVDLEIHKGITRLLTPGNNPRSSSGPDPGLRPRVDNRLRPDASLSYEVVS